MYKSEQFSNLPSHMIPGLLRYLNDGKKSGRFLMAVLENNFVGAYQRADTTNKAALQEWVWALVDLPSNCWGSKLVVEKWLKSGGVYGQGLANRPGRRPQLKGNQNAE